MKKYYTYLYLTLLTLPTVSFAATKQGYNPLDSLNKIGNQIYQTNSPQPQLWDVIANVVRILLSFVGIIFIILTIIGGLQWMTSGGNEQKVSAAKKRIVNATIGLVITVTAYAIAYWITDALNFATTTTPS